MESGKTIEDRVYLERVKLFFGSAIGNITSAIVGAFFIGLVLKSAHVELIDILIWFCFVVFFALTTVYIESRIKREELTIDNASKWLYIRVISGGAISLMYGLTPFLFSANLGIQEEMFLFIIFSAMVSIAIVGYTTMPFYYILLNATTMVPLSLHLLLQNNQFYYILAATSIICQYLVLSKGWKVSNISINSIKLYEQLEDELEEHKLTKERLHHLATHDELTGLPNRRLLIENLNLMISLAKRNTQEVFVMFIDLDGFKSVNDKYGHEAGDCVLIEVSKRLQSHIRESDTLARQGGDEFILSFMEVNGKKQDIDILANRILDSVSKEIELPKGHTANVGISIGIAKFPSDGNSPEDLIKAADASMYLSKSVGGGKFTYAHAIS